MAPATPKATRVPPKLSTKCEGRLQIARFGHHPQISPTKTSYVATFTPYLLGSVWGLKSRYLEGEEALREFLWRLGINAERTREAVDELRVEQKTTVSDVVVSAGALKDQDLMQGLLRQRGLRAFGHRREVEGKDTSMATLV